MPVSGIGDPVQLQVALCLRHSVCYSLELGLMSCCVGPTLSVLLSQDYSLIIA